MSDIDRRVIQCNYSETTRIATSGARAYVCLTNPGGGHDRIDILVRSKSGRWVRKWEDIRRLENFRVKVLPADHPRFGDERIWDTEPDVTAGELAAAKARVT